MIEEQYVSFETAKLLVQKGFDFNNAYTHYYTLNGEIIERNKGYELNVAPRVTQQMAMRWLREVHHIHIIAEPCLGEGNEPNLSFNRWFWTILKEEGEYKPIRKIDEFPTYEEACEAAIKYCLTELI